jgi:MiaB/RimO family radical SAM methylthiotransferase
MINNMEPFSNKAYVISNGCPENLMDSARLKSYLENNGWQIVNDSNSADFVFFNACGLTCTLEKFSINIIENLQSGMKKPSRLFVWGCLPKINAERIKQVYDGPLFGEQELFLKIDEILQSNNPIEEISSNNVCQRCSNDAINWLTKSRKILFKPLYRKYIENALNLNLHRPNDDSIFYIKISTGCLGNCAYCAIRNSRGVIRSKSIGAIIQEFRTGLSLGYKEFSLMGTDLGGQGRDLGYGLCDLLNALIKEKGDYKIGLRNINPFLLKQMLDDLEPILKTSKVWFIGMAAESGSNKILKLMGRKYTVEDYVECFKRIKVACPDIVIRNQMLVGFPSETEHDFSASMRLISGIDFDFSEVYSFSPRPGTPAEKLEGQIPTFIKQLRYYRMLFKIIVNNS